MKKIIINADDFGYSKIFNDEILKLARDEKITGISVMVDYIDESQKEQVEEVKKYKNILGLHCDFENIDLEKTSFDNEIERQFRKFIGIFGFKPVFLDMHKYSHRENGNLAIKKFCLENNLFYRNLDGEKNKWTTSEEKITGSFLSFEEIKNKINELPENSSTTILFHPGKYDPNSKSSFNEERIEDVKNILLLNSYIEENDNLEKISYLDLR